METVVEISELVRTLPRRESPPQPVAAPAEVVYDHSFSHAGLLRTLALTAGVLFGLHLLTVVAYLLHWPAAFTMADKFYFDRESNFPSIFSFLLLLTAAALLGVIASHKRRHADPFKFQWRLLAWIFLGLALDEAVSIHELLIDPLRFAFHLSGWLRFSWVLVGVPVVGGLGLAYLRFLQALPTPARVRFMVAGAVYVTGVIGLEMISGCFFVNIEDRSPTYLLLMTLEETAEIVGVLLFIRALLLYLRPQVHRLRLAR